MQYFSSVQHVPTGTHQFWQLPLQFLKCLCKRLLQQRLGCFSCRETGKGGKETYDFKVIKKSYNFISCQVPGLQIESSASEMLGNHATPPAQDLAFKHQVSNMYFCYYSPYLPIFLKSHITNQAQWFTSIIPDIWEAEIGELKFEASPRKKSQQDPISENKLSMMVHTCNPSNAGGISRRIAVKGWFRQKA